MDQQTIVHILRKMKPGQRIDISHHEMPRDRREFMGLPFLDDGFTPADRIMENIPGSAYEYRYRIDEMSRCFVFERLAEPLPLDSELMSYVSPDRRHLFNRRTDGFYERNHEAIAKHFAAKEPTQ